MKNDRKFTMNQDDDDIFFDGEENLEEIDDSDMDEIEVIEVNTGDTDEAESEAAVSKDEDKLDYSTAYDEVEEEPASPKKKSRMAVIALAAVVIVAALVVAAVLVERYTPCKEYVELSEYFSTDNQAGSVPIVMDNKVMTGCIYVDNTYYLGNSFLQENIDDKFYYDKDNNSVIYTTPTQIYTIPVGGKSYDIDGSSQTVDYVIVQIDEDMPYISVDFLKEMTGYTYIAANEPQRLVIISDGSSYTSVKLADDAIVRDKASIKGRIVVKAADTSMHWMLGTEASNKGWTQVVTVDGLYGYVKTESITISDTQNDVVYDTEYVAPEYTSQLKDYKVELVWHAVYGQADNDAISNLLADTSGITTVSPTWYKAVDAEGNITSMADWNYISYIHDNGMEIWPLISDFTSTDADAGWDEKALLSNTDSRRKLIENIMYEAVTYGYDGFNIDFEKVPSDASADYIQFIRELSIRCRKAGITLSVDNYVPMSHNLFYNRKAQGECVDYVIVMGYDEHYSGGEEAGSVASISFVKSGLDRTLEEVPANKVINALPFYTRLWTEGTDENGENVFQSKSYSMQGGIDVASELGLEVKWDDEVKQNVASGFVENLYYSIWLEDDDSMKARMDMVNQRNIAGVAAWSLGMETDSVWDIIRQ